MSAGLGGSNALPVAALYTRDIGVRGFAISNASVSDLAAAAVTINASAERPGAVVRRVAAVLPLGAARRAHELLEKPPPGHRRGRIVIDVAA